jgi:hypothetical protein
MVSQCWCGQSMVRALRPAPERTHDFKTWPRISRNPSNPKPVTLEMCGVRVWTVVSGSPRCVAVCRASRGFTRLGIRHVASGRCGGYNSSNTHTKQGGVGHNNIVHQQINTHTLHASPRQAQSVREMPRAGRGAKMHLSMARNHAPAPIAPTSCCMHAHAPQTLYHRARMHPIPFQIMGWPWVSIYTSGAQVQG